MATGTRAVSSTLGVVLLFSLVIAGMVVIVTIGATALEQTKDELGTGRAEKALTQFDSKAAIVALGQSERQSVAMSGRGNADYAVRDEKGWMNVTVENTTSGEVATITNVSLGVLVYENGQTTIAYQGGGVWKKTESGARMISPPEFHFRNATLTLPIISIEQGEATGGRAEVSGNGSVLRRYPNATLDENFTNPVENGKVNVTVKSEYYEAWGTYFERRTDGNATYDHDENTATITLVELPGTRKITEGLVVTGGGGELQIQSGNNAALDSYNASTYDADAGPSDPPSSFGGGADIVTGMDVKIDGGNAHIKGNITTGGEFVDGFTNAGNHFTVDGYAQSAEGSVNPVECIAHVAKWCNDNASVDLPEPIDGEIQETIDDLESDNDNADEPCFTQGEAVDWESGGSCGTTITMGAGDYYTNDNFELADSTHKLLLDTTNGDITIAVGQDSDVKLDSGNLTILGDGTVQIYSTANNIQIKNSFVWNRGWDAGQLWIYGSKSTQVQFQNNPDFVGVVYVVSEEGASNSGLGIQGGQTDIYGAVVGGDGGSSVSLENNADIHYDESLSTQPVFPEPSIPPVSYLHVSVNRVNITKP